MKVAVCLPATRASNQVGFVEWVVSLWLPPFYFALFIALFSGEFFTALLWGEFFGTCFVEKFRRGLSRVFLTFSWGF